MDEAFVAAAFEAACVEELAALKPGNVHVFASGHGMEVEDFRASARAAAPHIARRGARVGARVLAAVEASWAAVAKNTNLGILLLCAPLALAAERGGDLRETVAAVLADLGQADAADAFRAIALASPAGLGTSAAHDVREPALATLLEAMQAAASRDRIAHQYAHGFADIFDIGLPALRAARHFGGMWPTVTVHLAFLAAFADSHISRKYGDAAARQVMAEGRTWHRRLLAAAHPEALTPALLDFDASLKRKSLNPGTSADLTVATLFAARLSRGHRQ